MSAGNCIRQFLVMIVRVETGNLSSLGRRHIGHTLNGAKVEFAILERVVRGNKFEGVYTEAGDAADGGGNASRTEEVKERMSALMVMDMEIPEHCLIWAICLRVLLMAAIQGRKKYWITDKEGRNMISNNIVVTLLSEELH